MKDVVAFLLAAMAFNLVVVAAIAWIVGHVVAVSVSAFVGGCVVGLVLTVYLQATGRL